MKEEKMNQEMALLLLDGIKYKEWKRIKMIIDNKFEEQKYESTLNVDENAIKEIKVIY